MPPGRAFCGMCRGTCPERKVIYAVPAFAAAVAFVFAAIAGFVAGASARPAASWFGRHLNVPSADVPDPVFAEVSAAAVLAWRRVFPAAVDQFALGSDARVALWLVGIPTNYHDGAAHRSMVRPADRSSFCLVRRDIHDSDHL